MNYLEYLSRYYNSLLADYDGHGETNESFDAFCLRTWKEQTQTY